MRKFANRSEAGKMLAAQLAQYADQPNAIVLALPRGGVPVAYEIAKALHLPLDILVVRKLGVPGHEELAMGAIAANDTLVLNPDILSDLQISKDQLDAAIQKERAEVAERETKYRANKPFPRLKGKTVLLVDDGVATGATIRAAMQLIQTQTPQQLVLALPVAEISVFEILSSMADKAVCLLTPSPLYAVGAWYEAFAQVSDAEVVDCMKASGFRQVSNYGKK